MTTNSRSIVATGLCTVAFLSFFIGRHVEERALAAISPKNPIPSEPPLTIEPVSPSYRIIAVAQILALPFTEFYEALRAAPAEARKKWASEIAKMPEGPRRTAAASGFYKLLVQFDPAAAVKAIGEIEDVRLQSVALGAAVNAAPGFAMQDMAELTLSLESRMSAITNRDYLSDVLLEWMRIDAPAVARFLDQYPDVDDVLKSAFPARQLFDLQFVAAWAAVDPEAARQWFERAGKWGDYWETRQGFVDGFYEYDRAAAVAYTLAHAEEEPMGPAVGVIVRDLYSDSKEEAATFVESLPEDTRRDALREAFRNLALGDENASGDPVMTARAIASWMTKFPPDYWKDNLSPLFAWSPSGAEGMLSWIEQQPPALREAVAAEYMPPFYKSPSEKIGPVLQVADPVLRDQLFRAILNNQSLDSDEASTAVAAAPISSEQKRHFLQIIAAVKTEKDRDYGSEK